MNKRAKSLVLLALCVTVVALLVWQRTQITKLRQQNAKLQMELAAWFVGPRTVELPKPTAAASPAPELLRLRAEVAELRRQTSQLARAARPHLAQPNKPSETAELPFETRVQHNTWGMMRLVLAMRSLGADREQSGATGAFPVVNASGELTPELRRECERFLKEDDATSAVDFNAVWPNVELLIADAADIAKLDGNTIIARTIAMQTPDGKWTRVYAFADGHAQRRVHNTPDEVWQATPP